MYISPKRNNKPHEFLKEINIPYIKQSERERWDVPFPQTFTPGELNFYLTQVCLHHESNYDPVSYSHFNEVVGALELCKQEFIRRMVNPYEDLKCKENGDVYFV